MGIDEQEIDRRLSELSKRMILNLITPEERIECQHLTAERAIKMKRTPIHRPRKSGLLLKLHRSFL